MLRAVSCCVAVVSMFFATAAMAGETPETVLLRKTIDNDKFAKRRGDAQQMMESYAQEITAYDANGTIDPRGWTVVYEHRKSFAQALASDLETKHFDFERAMPFIQVLSPQHEKAIATTIDSGVVIDKATGESQPLLEERLWFFDKIEEEWLVSGYVQNLGHSTTVGITRESEVVPELTELLKAEEESWEQGSTGAIAGLYVEKLAAYNSGNKVEPQSWKIIFGHREDWESWLTKRLRHAMYEIDRNVVYTTVGADGQEAIAVTRETVTTKYDKGPAIHSLDRYVLWLASRKSGSWRISQVFFDIALSKQ